MDLFSSLMDKNENLLPYDGIVHYYGRLFTKEKAGCYLKLLLDTIAWRNDEAVLFGKKIITKRKVA
ncbi:MAG: hypothetical protein QM763_16995 [Agriterribacter sp.]